MFTKYYSKQESWFEAHTTKNHSDRAHYSNTNFQRLSYTQFQIVRCDPIWLDKLRIATRNLVWGNQFIEENENGNVVLGSEPSLIPKKDSSNTKAVNLKVFDAFHKSTFMSKSLRNFTGIKVKPTIWYGPRIYQTGARLGWHVDKIPTHYLGVSLHIDSDLYEQWPIVIELNDSFVELAIEHGELLLYEGVRLPHFRPYPLAGKFYIGAFFHFQP